MEFFLLDTLKTTLSMEKLTKDGHEIGHAKLLARPIEKAKKQARKTKVWV